MNEHGQKKLQQVSQRQTRETDAWHPDLLQRYPALFGGKDLASFTGSSSVPEGWQVIFYNLLSRIEAFLTPQEQRAFEPLQVKEKFGCLRFYFRLRKARSKAAQMDDTSCNEWQDENDEDNGRHETAPPLPPREYLRIQFGHATQYALYAPRAAYGVDLARDTRLQALRDLVREAEMLTKSCCIRCGSQHLPLLCIEHGYVRTLCLHCAARADAVGSVPRDEVREMLAKEFKGTCGGKKAWGYPISFWRLIEDGEVVDYVALADLPPDQRGRFLPHVTATQSLLGEVLPAETFQRLIGSWDEHLFMPKPKAGVRCVTVGEYWRRRFGQPFPSVPTGIGMPGVFESLDAMFDDAAK